MQINWLPDPTCPEKKDGRTLKVANCAYSGQYEQWTPAQVAPFLATSDSQLEHFIIAGFFCAQSQKNLDGHLLQMKSFNPYNLEVEFQSVDALKVFVFAGSC